MPDGRQSGQSPDAGSPQERDPPYTFSGDAPSASRDHIAFMNWTDYVLAAATLVVTLNVFTVFVLVRAHQK